MWRLIDTGVLSAAENMALDDTLLEARSEDITPDTLRFLRFSPPAVLVGYTQSVEQEIREDFCASTGIDINRRITGGGAIFFDTSHIGWELIASKKEFNVSLQLEPLFRKICNAVILGLKSFGIHAQFRGKNDIEVDGRKISGTGGTEHNGAFLFQGTILCDIDVETMLKALKIPTEKLKDKEVESIRERITSIKRELGYIPPVSEIQSAIRKGFEDTFHIHFSKGTLTKGERKLFEKKLSTFKSTQWIYRTRKPISEQGVIRSALKTKGGLIRVSLTLNLREKRIRNILITGDFFSYPSRAVMDLEAMLKNIRADSLTIEKTVESFFKDRNIVMPGVTPCDFVQAIFIALEKSSYIRYGFTHEEVNSLFTVAEPLEDILKKDISLVLLPYCAKKKDCEFRQGKDCTMCGQCTTGEGYELAQREGKEVTTIVNFEDLRETLRNARKKGTEAFIGCCCEAFYIKRRKDFEKIGLPGILIDIDNTTCYDLGLERAAYAGQFENQTDLKIPILEKLLKALRTSDTTTGLPEQEAVS